MVAFCPITTHQSLNKTTTGWCTPNTIKNLPDTKQTSEIHMSVLEKNVNIEKE